MFAALEADRFDIVANEVTISEERKPKYDLSEPYSISQGVIVTRKDDDSIKSLADLKGKRTAQNPTSNWAEVARNAGAEVESVDGFSQAITAAQRRPRGRRRQRQHRCATPIRPRHPDAPIKVAVKLATNAAIRRFAARKGSGLLPELNKALDELRADGTLTKISEKYLRPTHLGPEGRSRPVRGSSSSTTSGRWRSAAIDEDDSADDHQLRDRPRDRACRGAGAAVTERRRLRSGAVLHLDHPGTPLLVQLFIVFYALPQIGVKIDPFPAAVIAFSLNVGGYAAEIIRSAIQSIPKGQWEAAETIGLDYVGALRRIILPQATRVAVPPLSNTLISLVKDTSLASTILVTELFRTAQNVAAPTFEFFALYGTAALYYWIICLVLSFAQNRYERRLERYVAR